MKKNLGKIICTYIICFISLQNNTFAQNRKNLVGWMGDASFLYPSLLGLSYERHVEGNISITLNANGVFENTTNGFKASVEPRYYFKNKKDSTKRCNGWYLGIKPIYFYTHYKGLKTYSNNPITNLPDSTVFEPMTTYNTAFFVTLGKQWIFKSGIFINASIGIGPYKTIRFIGISTINESNNRNVISFITPDFTIRVGYAF